MITLEDVQRAIALPEFDVAAAHQKMIPLSRVQQRPPEMNGAPRVGGVLLLLYYCRNELYVALTRRRDDLNAHAGQISFPGGRQEPGETLAQTALRETYEEIGVSPERITILGELACIYIPPSDFEVHPFVGWYDSQQRPFFAPDPSEVAKVLEAPLLHFFDPDTRQEEPWELRGARITVPYFNVDGHKVWGATAIILSEFLERLRTVVGERL